MANALRAINDDIDRDVRAAYGTASRKAGDDAHEQLLGDLREFRDRGELPHLDELEGPITERLLWMKANGKLDPDNPLADLWEAHRYVLHAHGGAVLKPIQRDGTTDYAPGGDDDHTPTRTHYAADSIEADVADAMRSDYAPRNNNTPRPSYPANSVEADTAKAYHASHT